MKRHRIILIMSSLIFIGCNITVAQNVAKFSFEGKTGSTTTIDSISNTTFQISNHYNKPEKIKGIIGNALRLDGYSTWAGSSSYQLIGITNKITISAWYATESFNKENSAIISQINSASGVTLEVGPFGNISFVFYADGTKYIVQTSQAIEKYKWNYIVATADIENSKARILVNGIEWANLNLNNNAQLTLNNSQIYIGRHNEIKEFQGFLLTALNGAIDEVCVFKNILADSEIKSTYQKYSNEIPDLNIDPAVRHAGDYLRPQYHPMPNTSWTNEPYGLTYYNGKYHLFFQKNPNSPTLYFMHWGHITSPDLVNWTEEKIALSPLPGFSSFGIWSGSTVKNSEGIPVIVFTGVDGRKAGIGIAFANDDQLKKWTQYENNPVIPSPPSDYSHKDFRDPFIFKVGSFYYMIVGSGLRDDKGGILFTYKSLDLLNWENIDPLFRSINVNESGLFWEMPFFFPLRTNEYILGVTPVPTPSKPAETIYWIGKFENEKFMPHSTIPRKIELINGKISNLLSPAINVDDAGRITYIGIIPDDRNASSQIAAGWRHTFSIPRVIRLLSDSSIGQTPHPNLCRLRENRVTIKNRIIEKGSSKNLPEIFGNQSEFSFKIRADSASQFAIEVFKNEKFNENTSIFFDLENNQITLDRRNSSLKEGPKDYRTEKYIFDYRDTINVDVFLDHSTLEIFVDNITVFSCRVYPSLEESQRVDFSLKKGRSEILRLDSWKMKNMIEVNSSEVCEPSALPKAFRVSIIDKPTIDLNHNFFKVFPNPTNNNITVEFNGEFISPINIAISDMSGRVIINENVYFSQLTDSQIDFNLTDFASGVYLLNMTGSNKGSVKFVVTR